MSLRYRTILILGLLLLVPAGLSSALVYHLGTELFYAVEQRLTERLADHSLATVRDELAAMDLLTRDWASWDDTYMFIEELNPAYIRSNIVDETFTNTRLNLMLFVRTSGEVAFARAYDLEAGEEMPVPQGVYDALPVLTHPLPPGTGRQGVLLLPEGVLLVTARPILTSREEGPSRGTLVFGRFLSDDIVDKINAHGASVAIHRWDRPEDWPADLSQASASLSPGRPLLARPLNEEQIAGYALLTDLYGNPALVLTVVEERELYHQFRFALRLFMVNVALMYLLCAGVVILLLDRLVMRRLTALITEVRAIGAPANSGKAVTVRGRDKLAGLAEAINDMLAAIEQARQQQVQKLTVLYQAALTASSQETLDSMLKALAQQMGQALDVTGVYISLWDEKTNTATELISWFGPEASEQERAAIAADLSRHPTVVSALRERRPTILHASGPLNTGDRAEVERYGWKYLLIVPLVMHEHSIGFVGLSESRREREFTEADISFCQTLAADAAAAIERARLYEREQRARERTEALYRIGQIVNSTLDPDPILDRLTEEAVRATGATHGSVLVPDPERGIFEHRSLQGYSSQERERAQSRPLSLTEGINSRAYRTRMTYYVPDVRQDPDYFPLIPTTRSELVIPLLRGDRILGNLDLQSPQVDAFRNVDMEFLRALADQVAIALENARLYQEERRRAREQAVLARIATALNTMEVRRAFRVLASGLRTLTGCDRVAVTLLDDTRTRYRVEVLETPVPVLEAGILLPLSTTPVWADILAGNPHFCPDMGAEVDYEAIRALYDAGFRSYVSLPLGVGGRVIGALHVGSLRVRHFRRAQVRLLQRVADALAVAMENERLYRAEQEQRVLAEALAQAVTVVSSTLDPDEMMGRILEQVARVVPGDAFNIMLVENGNARVSYWKGYKQFGVDEKIAFLTFPVADIPNLRRMTETGEPVLIPDTYTDPDWIRVEGWEWLRAYLGAPIVVKRVVVGFLNVDSARPYQYTSADAARLKLFATHVATALENARLYQELQDHARTLEERVRERTALLAAQYARLEAILRSTGDGILLTDAQGEILQANPVVQQWLAQDLASEDARKLQEAIQRVARRAQEQPGEIVELSGLDLEVRASPVEGPEGEGAAVVILHDVTQFKTLERLRTRFISHISHELRTPITTIKTYLHLLREMPELLPRYLDILEREADWHARLVEDVLEISRLDSGALQMHFGLVGLNALVAEVVDAKRPLALAQGLLLECHLAEEEPVAPADLDALRTVLINLIYNSIQYTPSGGRVEVTTGEEERDGHRWATVTVADTGIGIPQKELPYIFERFFRGEWPRQMQIPGTGLGLSIVKEIVDRHNGWITVESEEGKGTRFTFWLPVAEEGLLTRDDK